MSGMTLTHLFPWDVIGDCAAPARVRDLGVDAVALAAAYHSVRAATPLHPRHRLINARHAALYVPVEERIWRDRELRPAAPAWLEERDSFGFAAGALRSVGLPVYAWIVLTHASRVGEAHPQFVVRNAFDDLYPYALCPAHGEVIDYCVSLAREVVRLGKPEGVVLEAAGPLGFVHGGHHEKTEGADYDTVQQQLLSLCFCSACMQRYAQADLSAEALRQRVRAGIDAGNGAFVSVEAALGTFAPSVARVRAALTRALRQRVIVALRESAPELKIVLHASADPWATGAFASVAGGVDAAADVLVANCWPGFEASAAGIAALAALRERRSLGAYVLALPPRPCDARALRAELDAYAAAGVEEFHFYHAGLASHARLDAIRSALRGVKS